MNSPRFSLNSPRRIFAHACLATLAVSLALAQQAPAPDAATLAKYDTNHNGVIDPNEATAMQADQAAQKVTPDVLKSNDTVVMNPFEVSTDTRGYYAANTMSGTRMNSKIEDLASSITVVTKEQMEDFAMLDINDVFLYTVGTEGTGTYSAPQIDRNGSPTDNVGLNPTTTNRIRGIAPANVSLGNVETMGRVPIDPLTIDGLEVSRGPNANVFGLGNPSGTVNQVPANANLSRNRTEVTARGDSYGGYRTTLDANRVLVQGKLAVRGSAAFQQDEFQRKPSGVSTERYNGMIKYQPFKNTTISAFVQYYHSYGTRPNFIPPRDNVSYWLQSGKPTWDPVAQVIHVNGQTLGAGGLGTTTPFTSATGIPDYFTATFTGSTHNFAFVDQNGLGLWTVPQATATTSPLTATLGSNNVASPNAWRYLTTTPAANSALGKITTQPLFTSTPTVSDKGIYDWSDINLNAINSDWDRTITSNLQLDQVFFNTPRQQLAAQFGFMREDSMRYQRNLLGGANDNGQSGQLFVDVNEKLLDGTPNPYFMRPYVGTDQPRTVWLPAKWDTYRAQVAYKFDFTHESNPLKWLGLHQFTGYDEYKYRINRSFSYRDVITDAHSWIPAGTIRGNQGAVTGGPAAAPNYTRSYFRYYVGDTNGGNVDYAPSNFQTGNYTFVWGGAGGVFNREPATLGQAAVTDSAGAGANSKTILKTSGGVLQSHLLNEDLITTFGLREDKVYTKFGGIPQINSDGITYNYASLNSWAPGDYRFNSGKTNSEQFVLRPFKDLPFASRLAQAGGAGEFLSGLMRGIQFTLNNSDSFLPQAPAQDLFQTTLPNTTGKDRSYGIGLNLFDGKLVIRATRYDSKQLGARNGDANTVATRAARIDIGTTDAFNFVKTAQAWVAADPRFTTIAAQADEVARVTGLSTAEQQFLTSPVPGLASTNDVEARGTEIEVNYNPTPYWTVSANGGEQKVINTNVSATIQTWIDQRMAFWTTAVDTRTNTLWWTTPYSGNAFLASGTTPSGNFASFVNAPYSVIQQKQGKSNPTIREYNFRLATNYRLAGITENKYLKNMFVGGSLRWESKAAVNYYGLNYKALLAAGQPVTQLDPNNPIYDDPHMYVDAILGYRTRLFARRIPATFQLNGRNLEEGGHLKMIDAFPDGTPSTYRIIDPREFFFTVTLDL